MNNCEMAAAYTQHRTRARLAYTFSGGVEPNAQGLLGTDENGV